MGPKASLNGRGKSRRTGIRFPDRSVLSESLHRLSYPGLHEARESNLLFLTKGHTTLIVFCFDARQCTYHIFFSCGPCGPTRAMASPFLRFLDHTQRRTTVGKTPLDE